MIRVLMLHCGHEGQTRKIMSRIHDRLQGRAILEMLDLRERIPGDIAGYQAVIAGASIRYGHFPKVMKRFVTKRAEELNRLPTAFFGVCLTARKPHKRTPESNVYLRKLLANILWQPSMSAAFAGALLYPRYRWYDRLAIRMIMRMTGGETDPTREIEYTDWDQVDAFADAFASGLPNPKPETQG